MSEVAKTLAQVANRPLDRAARPSFDEVFDREAAYVCQSLRRLGVRPDDVDDLAQDVFLSVYRALDQYDPARPIRPWLFAFVYRKASNYRRHPRRRFETQTAEIDRAGSGATPEQAASQAELVGHLERALELLSDEQRAVFVMCELDGFSGAEIAEIVGIPVNTAHSRIRLARQTLALAFRELRNEGGGR